MLPGWGKAGDSGKGRGRRVAGKYKSSSNLVTPALRPIWPLPVLFQLNSRATFLLDFLLQTDVQTSEPSHPPKFVQQTTRDWPRRQVQRILASERPMRTLTLFLLLSSAVILTSSLYGQGVASGDLRVMVSDPQGQPVANATVIARN